MSDEDAQGEQTAEDAESDGVIRCDYCRLPCPTESVTLEREDTCYEFCCVACESAFDESEAVFTDYHSHRRLQTGVSALDASLPKGVPRNSFVLLSDLAGTRSEAMQAELVWRALQRGEPVVLVSFLEPPVSVIQEFVSLSWNVLPSLEDGQLVILDCFTYRVDDRDRMHDRMNDWNTHLWEVAEDATLTVRDPTEMEQLQNRLDRALERVGAQDEGIVVLDSLTELGSLVQPVQAYNFLKDVRADICKGRFVPLFAGATVTGGDRQFPHDLGYIADGIVELQLNEDLVEDALLKQLRVRKMGGVLTFPQWRIYEFTSGRGLVTFDPIEELQDDETADDEPAEDAGRGDHPHAGKQTPDEPADPVSREESVGNTTEEDGVGPAVGEDDTGGDSSG